MPARDSSRRPRWSRALFVLLLLALLGTERSARAEDKRAPQDYGAPRDGSAGDVLLWGPRVVLFPLWLISEFLIRRPIGALVTVAEREQWPGEIVEFFTFGERGQFKIFPSALFDFGLRPSVGLNAKWQYLFAEKNTARFHFGTWGPSWLAGKVVDTYALSERDAVSLDLRFTRRPDNPFSGLGPRSRQSDRARYNLEIAEASVVYENRPWRSSSVELRTGIRHAVVDAATCCDDVSVPDRVAAGIFPSLPPGFGQSYTGSFHRLVLALDTRKPRPESGSGIRVEARGDGVFAPNGNDRRAWVRYGGEAGAFLDITGTQRVVALSTAVELADPLVGEVPFFEQAKLGGDNPMRGYLRDRLIDRSYFVGRLTYTWPVWVYLDGVIQVDAGNVFGAGLKGIDPKLFRLSGGIGVRSNGERDTGFELLVAGATDPLDEGFNVSSFRLLVGSHHGF